MACKFCFNAHVYAKIPKTAEEEYFGADLDDTNDFSSFVVGCSGKGFQLFLNTGAGEAINIEVCEWGKNERWNTVAKYYPKYCPECGRKLDEYDVGTNGTEFKQKS
jgi:hypothetical protein